MEYKDLIEEITRLVMLEMHRISGSSQGLNSKDSSKSAVLIDPEIENPEELFSVLGKISGKSYFYQLVCPGCMEQEIRKLAGLIPHQIIADPERNRFNAIAASADIIIVPYLSVNALAKFANLIGDEPVSGIFQHGVVKGIPVTVCTDYIHSLSFSDSSPSKKIDSMIRGYITILEEMGVSLIQLKSLTDRMEKDKIPLIQTKPTGKKHVVTREDIMTAANQKVSVLNLPRGTIITPLAYETAESLGIDIHLA